MWSFDQLPKSIRERLSIAKFDISPTDALNLYRTYGEMFVLRMIAITEYNIEKGNPYNE